MNDNKDNNKSESSKTKAEIIATITFWIVMIFCLLNFNFFMEIGRGLSFITGPIAPLIKKIGSLLFKELNNYSDEYMSMAIIAAILCVMPAIIISKIIKRIFLKHF